MTIYTRTGDQGETDLLEGGRVHEDAARLEVCGARTSWTLGSDWCV